jgi:acyl carrier protein
MNGDHIDEVRGLVAVALGKTVDQVPSGADIDNVSGWDSLGHMRLMLSLEARLGRTLIPEETVRLRSVRAIAQLLAHEMG